jgi:hypothetical protein
MNSERLWVVILSLVSCLAGLALGWVTALEFDPVREIGPESAFEHRFREEFGLDETRARDLAFVLDSYRKDVEDLKARHVVELEPELIALGQRCREQIRTYVLPEDRVAEFDRMELGKPVDTARGSD